MQINKIKKEKTILIIFHLVTLTLELQSSLYSVDRLATTHVQSPFDLDQCITWNWGVIEDEITSTTISFCVVARGWDFRGHLNFPRVW